MAPIGPYRILTGRYIGRYGTLMGYTISPPGEGLRRPSGEGGLLCFLNFWKRYSPIRACDRGSNGVEKEWAYEVFANPSAPRVRQYLLLFTALGEGRARYVYAKWSVAPLLTEKTQ